MKKLLLIFALMLSATAVYLYIRHNTLKEPEFVGISNLKVLETENYTVLAEANAIFRNPNTKAADLLNTELKISSNGVLLAVVSQTNLVHIAAESDFSVPFRFNADLVKLGLSQSLSGIVNQALSEERSIRLQFEGYCRMRSGSEVYKIPVTFEETLNIR